MAKPPLSMKPTGWFQVAWSDRGRGRRRAHDEVLRHRAGRVAVGVRPGDRDGRLLRTPRRTPRVRRPRRGRGHPVPVPRLAVERRGPQRLHPLRGPRPNRGRRMRTYPVAERNESIYIWHDVEGRDAVLRRARRVRRLRRRQQRRRLLPAAARCSARRWNCTRSTCWRTASTSRTSSSCTRRRSCRCSPGTTSPNPCPTSTSPSPSKVTTSRRSRTSRAVSRRSTAGSVSR